MDSLALRLRARLLPALLTAFGVALLTAGLLSYTTPVEAGPQPSEVPTVVTAPPTIAPSLTPRPSGAPTPVPTPTFPADRLATRIVVAALGIDLAVIKQPDPSYPACDVAMYFEALGQPGSGGATYLYAHARTGMFLPILEASKVNDGARMLGMLVEVYTSDDQLFLYEITEVRRHQLDLDDAIAATSEQVWLQTSEGPKGTRPKTQVVARFLSSGAADHDAAHPVARPTVCG
ncbi:MAG: Sortase [Chloroflexi bacterium]|nr:Sortase [Chloroflexota bacterium]